MLDQPPFDIECVDSLDRVPHGFFGHSGEAFQFGYGGPGDETVVAMARADAAHSLIAGAPLVAPHQVHSADVLTVTEAWPDSPVGRPSGDAVVTSEGGIVLGIVTADCGPVLFCDPVAGVIGAAHAGWRGAHAGILENTVVAMERLGATRANIAAAIGPTIAQSSYEVDLPFRAHFEADEERHFAPAPPREGSERWHFDLPGYIADKLERSGIGRICDTARDTFSDSERYYSYRRAASSGMPNYGRQISLIALG